MDHVGGCVWRMARASHCRLSAAAVGRRSASRFITSLLSRKPLTETNYEVISPAVVSPRRSVPSWVPHPEYAKSGEPMKTSTEIDIKTDEMIEAMRCAGQLALAVLEHGQTLCQIGKTTDEVDAALHDMIVSAGAYPSPLNYRNFPKSVCTSVNNVLCHGIPDSRALQDGDIISLDVTVYFGGVHGDTCATFAVGSVDSDGQRLIDVSRRCLWSAIEACGPGRPFSVIPKAIRAALYDTGFSVCGSFTGHGIGNHFHSLPSIVHGGLGVQRGVMLPGMTFTIEPIILERSSSFRILSDNWTAVSRDNGRASNFEHTLLVTETGVEVLTG